MLLTLLCDWSAHLHTCRYNVIQRGHFTASECANTHKLLEGGMNIGFLRSICRTYNCISVLRLVQNVVLLIHVSVCAVLLYQQR
jgi:hypothetical protein